VYSQGVAIQDYGLVAQGVCGELCRRWAAGHLAGTWTIGETIWEVDNGRGGFAEVLEAHRQRRNYTEENKGIQGLGHATARQRTAGCFKYKGLRSRTDVIDHVLAVPGVFIFLMTGSGDTGHAMAFDSRGETFEFFDPNQGEWGFTNEAADAIRAWWNGFWDATGDGEVDYKRHFHRGDRELVKYTTI
jgi:hypothetical protein